MAEGLFIAYYRVSTERQGRSGLGLEAQREAVLSFLNGGKSTLVAEFTEVESGKKSDRAELARALQACRVYGASLLIAKLDRLSRDAHFLLGLQKAGVPFVAVDMPHADQLTVGILAMVAQKEREMISARTKAALAAARARGAQLGGARGAALTDNARMLGNKVRSETANRKADDLATVIKGMMMPGESATSVARALTAKGIPTPSGRVEWQAVQVQRVLSRAARIAD